MTNSKAATIWKADEITEQYWTKFHCYYQISPTPERADYIRIENV